MRPLLRRCCNNVSGEFFRLTTFNLQNFFSSLSEQAKQLQVDINISKQQENITLLQKRQVELQDILEKENTWDNSQLATQLSQELSTTTISVEYFKDIDTQLENLLELSDLATEENDDELLEECTSSLSDMQQALRARRLKSVMSNEQDQSGCYVEIISGAGGADAFHWTKMLANMYSKWGKNNGYQVTYIDEQHDDSTGGVGGQVQHQHSGWYLYT